MKVGNESQGASLGKWPAGGRLTQHGFEESLALKRNLLISILALVPATLLSLAVSCQAAPVREKVRTEQADISYKYEVYAGYGYTGLNQVNQSRYGLQGVNLSLTRNFGKYFGVVADGAFYKYPLSIGDSSNTGGNPGSPVVDEVFLGPELHGNLYGRVDGFFHALLGGAHTGGESMTPNISFAGGAGGGLDYRLSRRLSIRASGDEIAASFSVTGNTPALGYSPHMTKNARATVGLVYKF